MLELFKKVLLINLVASALVLGLSQYVEWFQTTRLIDFLFVVVFIIWGLAKLMWDGGRHSKTTCYDDAKTDSVYKMVSDHDFKKDEQETSRQNYQDGFVLFLAGIPAFLACLYLQFIA
ncbi:hypothetical protein TW81_11445 [Vibrio galatheae]|uniref:DUF3899 domain-containing protein n=1 Tax=Vibrio galatheae TaxID=579748 RepID=A0A0F4NI60_9VIBR|nr:hypothetical protein [Vibrio galatheae]KJY82820.1 hypothetical protein TW81_11445 [Vibrio galatheae]